MPKRLDPRDAKPFQPIERAFVNDVLSDTVQTVLPPQAPPVRPARQESRQENRVVQMRREEEEPAPAEAFYAEEGPEEGRARDHHPDRLTRVLKAKVSASEHLELQRIVSQLARELETPVSATHVIRALITILRHAESKVTKRARSHGPMKRPSNEDLAAIAAFEFKLAKLLAGALRDAPPLSERPRE